MTDKDVKQKTTELGIQVDNLCTLLPQVSMSLPRLMARMSIQFGVPMLRFEIGLGDGSIHRLFGGYTLV